MIVHLRDGKVDEAQVNVVDRLAPLAAGASGELTLDMTPGKYLLICNLTDSGESHYQAGMVAFLLVEP